MNFLALTQFDLRTRGLFFAVLLFLATIATASYAQTFTTVFEFAPADGGMPWNLTQGFDGNFYGTTQNGGVFASGTVFKITPNGLLTTLHNFCSLQRGGFCDDGTQPGTGLALATSGNLYGTTTLSGPNPNNGTAFKITTEGKFTVLDSFSGYPTNGSDALGLVQADDGSFYGVTQHGGTNCAPGGCGTFIRMTPQGVLTTLYSFCSQPSCTDGTGPAATPIQATDGNLYGLTLNGGTGSKSYCQTVGCGTIFQVSPSGKLTTLHSFDGTDGLQPYAIVQGTDGSLYGVTALGGRCLTCGTVFKMSPQGVLTTLYRFCSQPNCSDGDDPVGLLQATDGNFYGATYFGGTNSDAGTLFQLTPQGVLTTLYNFCSQPSCTDGSYPNADLMQATDGNLYGTTSSGGLDGINSEEGTVFRLSMGLSPFVKFVRDSGRVGQSGGILGQGFTGTTAVSLNGVPASFAVVSDTYIQATVPAGATSGYVTVNTPSGTLTSNVPFQVIP